MSYTPGIANLILSDSRPLNPVVGTVRIGLAYDITAPTTPTSLTLTPGNTAMQVVWVASTDNIGVVGYRVRRDGTLVATVTSGVTYNDTGLTNGTTYSYTVSAYDAQNNESAQTAAVTGVPTVAPTVRQADTFNRANSTTTLNPASDGGTWTSDPVAAVAGISTNAALIVSGGGFSLQDFVRESSSVFNCTISADFPTVGTEAGLCFRYVDTANFWYVTNLGLAHKVGGTVVTYSGNSTNFVSGDHMDVVCNGSSVIVKRNGAQVNSGVDSTSTATATRHGIHFTGETVSRIDNWSVSA